MKDILHTIFGLDNEVQPKITPSRFIEEMEMTTDERMKKLCQVSSKAPLIKESSLFLKSFQFSSNIIIFQKFLPGEAYHVQLAVQNICKELKALGVAYEGSPVFKVTYSSKVVTKIAPGMSVSFSVQFIPEEKRDYTHAVTFYTDTDSFTLPIIALGPRPLLDIPDQVQLPSSPVKIKVSKMLIVRNIGGAPAAFSFITQRPFAIEPLKGFLKPDETTHINIDFISDKAGDYEGILKLQYDTGEEVFSSLHASAENLDIHLERGVLRVEDTFIGLSRQRSITLFNGSSYSLEFKWKKYASCKEENSIKSKLLEAYKSVQELEKQKHTDVTYYEIADYETHISTYERILKDEAKDLEIEDFRFNHSVFSISPLEGELWPNSCVEFMVVFKPEDVTDYTIDAYCDVRGREKRIPLKLQGKGKGPVIQLNVDSLNIDKIFLRSYHTFEIVAFNKGDVPGSISFEPTDSAFGGAIYCDPASYYLHPGECRSFVMSYTNPKHGDFVKDLVFRIQESGEILKTVLTGSVISPILSFEKQSLNFGEIGIGYTYTRHVALNNLSAVPIEYSLKVADAGNEHAYTGKEFLALDKALPLPTNPKEIKLEPQAGTIAAYCSEDIKIILTANKVRQCETAINAEMWDSGAEAVVLPLRYTAKYPNIVCVPDKIVIHYSFIGFPYNRTISLQNTSKLPTCFRLVPEENSAESAITYSASVTRGSLKSNSKIEIPITITTHKLGHQALQIQILLMGAHSSIPCCIIVCNGQGPVINAEPQELDWGQTELLEERYQILTVMNDSPIPATFSSTLNGKYTPWSVDPSEGKIRANGSFKIKVTVYLIESGHNKDVLQIHTEYGSTISISLKAFGVGTSIEFEPKVFPTFDFGVLFSYAVMKKEIKVTNKGRRKVVLFWSQSPDRKMFRSRNVDEEDQQMSIFTFSPLKLELAPKEQGMFTVQALCYSAKTVTETFYCTPVGEKKAGKPLVMNCEMMAIFIEPLLKFSVPEITFQLDIGPDDEFPLIQESLAIENVSLLPLTMELSIKYPFAMKFDEEMEQNKEVHLGMHRSICTAICFNSAYKTDRYCKHLKTSVCIHFKDHPSQYLLPVTADVYFPNIKLEPSEFDYGCRTVGNHGCEMFYENISTLPAKYFFQWIESSVQINYLNDPKTYPEIIIMQHFSERSDSVFDDSGESNILSNVGPYTLNTEEVFEEVPSEMAVPLAPPVSNISSGSFKEKESPFSESINSANNNSKKENHDADSPQQTVTIESQENEPSKMCNRELLHLVKHKLMPLIKEFDSCYDEIASLKSLKETFEAPEMISQIFELIPNFGIISPFEKHYGSVGFSSDSHISAEGTCHCIVEGGPTEQIHMKAKSSCMTCYVDKDFINFGCQVYHKPFCDVFTVYNTGSVGFEFAVNTITPMHDNLGAETYGLLEVHPHNGFVKGNSKVDIKVTYHANSLGKFSEQLQVEVGYFNVFPVFIKGYAELHQVFFYLPRRHLSTLPIETGYAAIASITPQWISPGSMTKVDSQSIIKINKPQVEMLKEEGWIVIAPEEQYPTIGDIDLAIERLTAERHTSSNPFIFLQKHSGSRTKSIPNLVVAPYLLDFGPVIPEKVVTYDVKLINMGPGPVTVSLLKDSYKEQGIVVKFKDIHDLPVGCVAEIPFVFHPLRSVYPKRMQEMEHCIYFEVHSGSRIPVEVRAVVTVPHVTVSTKMLNFGQVKCGECKVLCVALKNEGLLPCHWHACIESSAQIKSHTKGNENSTNAFFIKYAEDNLNCEEVTFLDIFFQPQKAGHQGKVLVITMDQNPDAERINLQGTGLEPHLLINEPVIDFSPLLPHPENAEKYFTVENPCSYPIEFFFPDYDREIQEEERLIRILTHYYQVEELYIPVRKCGDPLPAKFSNFFQQLIEKVREKLRKKVSLENAGSENEMLETEVAPSTFPCSCSTLSMEGSFPEDTEKLEDFIHDYIDEEHDKIEFSYVEDDTLRTYLKSSIESVPQKIIPSTPGIVVIFYGAPTTDCFHAAYKAGRILNVPVLSIDDIIITSAALSPTIASMKVKDLIYAAFEDYLLQSCPEQFENVQLENAEEMQMSENVKPLDIWQAKENNELKDSIEKLQDMIDTLTEGSENSLLKSPKESSVKSQTPKSKEIKKRSSKQNENKSKETACMLQLPENLLVEILKQRLQFLDYVIINGLNSKLFGNIMLTLNGLLEAVGNKCVNIVIMYNTYSQYVDWLIAKKETEEMEAEIQYENKINMLKNLDDDELELLNEEDVKLLESIRLIERKTALEEQNEAMKQKEVLSKGDKGKKTKENQKKNKAKDGSKSAKEKMPESNESKQKTKDNNKENKSDKQAKGNKSKSDKSSKSPSDTKAKGKKRLKDMNFDIPNEAELIQQFKEFEENFSQILKLSQAFDKASLNIMSQSTVSRNPQRRSNTSEMSRSKTSNDMKNTTNFKEKELPNPPYEWSLWIVNNKTPETPIMEGVFKELVKNKDLEPSKCGSFRFPILQEEKREICFKVADKDPLLDSTTLAENRMAIYSVLTKSPPRIKPSDTGVFKLTFVEKIKKQVTELETEDKIASENTIGSMQNILPSLRKVSALKELGGASELSVLSKRNLINKTLSPSSTSSTILETRKSKSISANTSLTKRRSGRKSSKRLTSANSMNEYCDDDILRHRWILEPGEKLLWQINCDPPELGDYSQEYNIETATWNSCSTIRAKALVCLPSFLMVPEEIFLKVAETKLNDKTYFNTYFLDSETFDFGAVVLNPKSKQSCEVTTMFRFRSNSEHDTEIYFKLENQKPEVFKITTNQLVVKSHELAYLTIGAHPNAFGRFSATLRCEIKNNPSLFTVKMNCVAVKPDIHIDPKVIAFDQTLLHRKETCTLQLTTKCLAPLRWKFMNMDVFEEDFEFSASEGVLYPQESEEIQITYAASKVGVFAKQPLKVEVFSEKDCDEVLLSETVHIRADTCDIMLDVQLDNENVNFEKVKVGIAYEKKMYLRNIGRHDYCYQIIYEPKDHVNVLSDLENIIKILPAEGKISHGGQPCVLKVKLKAVKELELKNTELFKCYILDARNRDNTIGCIPIRITVSTFYSRYVITPTPTIDFGALMVGTRQKQNLFIKNIGLFPFKYTVLAKLEGALIDSKSDISSLGSSRSKQDDSSKPGSRQSDISPKKKKQKEKSKKGAKKVSVGPFTVYEAVGEVSSSDSVLVPIECIATGEGDYDEEIFICISESEKVVESIRLLGRGCYPGIDFSDVQSIFQEHQVCQTADDFRIPLKGESYCLYIQDENTFKFFQASICKEAKAALRFQNRGLISCTLRASISEVAVEDNGVFSVSPSSTTIEQHSTGVFTITFSPKAIQEYVARLNIILEPNLSTFSIKLCGEGIVPQIKLTMPVLLNPGEKPQIVFHPTFLGCSSKKQLEFKNSGDISCKVIVELCSSSEGIFTLDPTKETVPFLKLWESQGPIHHTTIASLMPNDTATFTVTFMAKELGYFKGEIKLSVPENPFENITVLLSAEAYIQDITLDKIQFSENQVFNQEQEGELEAPTYQLDFGPCYVGQKYQKHFTICNNSDFLYRFEWTCTEAFVFTPRAGHILSMSSKDITVTLISSEEMLLEQVSFKSTLARIELIGNERSYSNVWDSTKTAINWTTNSSEGLECNNSVQEKREASIFKSTVMEEEPEYQILDDNIGQITLYLSAVVAYPKYECNVTEIKFKDTLMFQSRIYKFCLSNLGVVPIYYRWQIHIQEATSTSLLEMTSFQQEFVNPVTERPLSRGPTEARPLTGKEIFLDMRPESAVAVAQKPGPLNNKRKLCPLKSFPFKLEPETGMIMPNESTECVITFSPLEIFEYSGKLKLSVEMDNSENPIEIQVSGRSLMPYCHFDVEESDYLNREQRTSTLSELLSFGTGTPLDANTRVIELNVLGTGIKCTKKFFAINPTEKSYSYSWRNIKLFHSSVTDPFNCITLEGHIECGKRAEMSFTFLADDVGTYESFWNFVIPEYDIQVPFLLVGNVSEPCVFFLKAHVELPPTLKGVKTAANVILTNNESIPLNYKFKPESLYSEDHVEQLLIEPLSHTLEPQNDQLIRMELVPSRPGDFEFRPQCYVKRLQHPLILHVTGHCYAVELLVNYTDQNGKSYELQENGVQNMDFGNMIPKHNYAMSVTLTNIGKTAFKFLWIYNEEALQSKNFHFHVFPKEGYVSSQSREDCIVKLEALKKAELNNFEVILQIYQGPKYKLLIHGSATTPNFAFSFSEYDFGYCFIQESDKCFYSTCLEFVNKEEDTLMLECHFENKPHLTVEFRNYHIQAKEKVSITICFLPREIKKYEEVITFIVNGFFEKRIKILGEGTLVLIEPTKPEYRCINLGALSINQVSCKTISVCNRSKCPAIVKFQWLEELQALNYRNDSPRIAFSQSSDSTASDKTLMEVLEIQPSNAVKILPQKAIDVSFIFKPVRRMSPFVEKVMVQVNDHVEPLCVLKGSCLDAEFALDRTQIHFGALVQGCKATVRIMLINKGDMGSRFAWKITNLEDYFSISPMTGYSSPGSVITTSVTFHPPSTMECTQFVAYCCIEHYKSLDLSLLGSCVELPPPKEVIQFKVPVRQSDKKEIQIQNDSSVSWRLYPEMSGEFFSGANNISITSQATETYVITYTPLRMTAEEKHTGSVIIRLPDARVLLYALVGEADPPDPNERLERTVPCKTSYTELLNVVNWLSTAQRFHCSTALIKGDKVDPIYSATGNEYIEVPPHSQREYKLKFHAYKEAVIILKVNFQNENDGEFQFYEITVKIVRCGPLDFIKLSTYVRIPANFELQIQNPLKSDVNFDVSCSCADLHFPADLLVPAESNKSIKIEYLPLIPGEKVVQFELISTELGTYPYEIHLKALCALAEKAIQFLTYLGSHCTKKADFVNLSQSKSEFKCEIDNQNFRAEKNTAVIVPPNEKGYVEVTFEPTDIGSTSATLKVKSTSAGEFVFPLNGICKMPVPQGPFTCRYGESIAIPFRNVFLQEKTFSIDIDVSEFTVKETMIKLKPKMDTAVELKMKDEEELQSLEKRFPVTGRLVIRCTDPALCHIPWVYYLKGLLN